MIFTYKQLTDHNRTFFEEMVDLKVAGWDTFSKSANAYSFNFYKDQLKAMDEAVDKLASDMKGFGNE